MLGLEIAMFIKQERANKKIDKIHSLLIKAEIEYEK